MAGSLGVVSPSPIDLDEFGVFRVAVADYDEERLQFELAGQVERTPKSGGQFEVGGSKAGRDPSTDTALCRAG